MLDDSKINTNSPPQCHHATSDGGCDATGDGDGDGDGGISDEQHEHDDDDVLHVHHHHHNNNNCSNQKDLPLACTGGDVSNVSPIVSSLESDMKSKLKLDLHSKRKLSTFNMANFHISHGTLTCKEENTISDDEDDSEDQEDFDDDLTTGSVSFEVDEDEVQSKNESESNLIFSTNESPCSKENSSSRQLPCDVAEDEASTLVASPMRRCSTLRKSFNQLLAKTAKMFLPNHHHRHRSFHRHSAKCCTCPCRVNASNLTRRSITGQMDSSSTLPFICTPSDELTGLKKKIYPMTRVFSDGHVVDRVREEDIEMQTTASASDVSAPVSSVTSPTSSEKMHTQSMKDSSSVTGNEHKRLLELPDRFDTRIRRKSDSFLLKAQSPVTSGIVDAAATCASCSCSSTSYFLLLSPKLVDARHLTFFLFLSFFFLPLLLLLLHLHLSFFLSYATYLHFTPVSPFSVLFLLASFFSFSALSVCWNPSHLSLDTFFSFFLLIRDHLSFAGKRFMVK